MTTLLVASTGGHLSELHELAPRLESSNPRVWVTFDSPQSRWLLRDENAHFVSPSTSRDLLGTAKELPAAWKLQRELRADRVISTGSSVAVAFLPLLRTMGAKTDYIESATRTSGPSTTGRIVAKFPGVSCYTQHPDWQSHKWKFVGSVFDGYESTTSLKTPKLETIVVTLGTHPKYGFRRLVEQLVKIIPSEPEVLWQIGPATNTTGLGIQDAGFIDPAELAQAMTDADLVITHAGVGSALAAFQTGKSPLYIPRRKRFDEHVDDHQVALATDLDRRGLAVTREAHQVSEEDLFLASAREVHRKRTAPALLLDRSKRSDLLLKNSV